MKMQTGNTTLSRLRSTSLLAVLFAFCVGAPVLAAGDDTGRASADMAAQPSPFPADPTLEDYLRYAMQSNPELKAAWHQWKAEVEKAGYAGALPDPMLSYGYYVENVETRVGPQRHRFSLKQSFPWFGTLGARADVARASAAAAFQQLETRRLELAYRVRRAVYAYWLLDREIGLTADNLELLKFWEEVVRTKYKVAVRQHPDVIKAQVELGVLEDRLLTLQDRIAPTVAGLREALNLPDSVFLPVPKEIPQSEDSLARDSLLEVIRAANPDLRALQHLISREQKKVDLARKAAYPDFTLGVDYIETGSALDPAMRESGKDPWVVSVGINLPIWFGKNSARRDEARARERAARYTLEARENRLTEYADRLLFEYANALRKKRLYRDGLVPKAEQSLNASYAAYQAGELDFLNVLEAQRQLLDFQLKLDRATADAATRRAEIDMLAGREINPDK